MTKITKELQNAVITNFTMHKDSNGEVIDTILLNNLPIPPTSNHQYKLVNVRGKVRHAPSQSLVSYRKSMDQYALQYRSQLNAARVKLGTWQNNLLEIRAVFFFHAKTIFNQQGLPKRLDTSNRLKALHDSLAGLLDVDDCWFFRVYAEKAYAHESLAELCCVEILPMGPIQK